MSFPIIPNITPNISITNDQVLSLLLASIAFEELGLAHMINAEAEKLQAALGSPLTPGGAVNEDLIAEDLDQLLEANRSAERMLQTIIKKEMLLQFKTEDVLDFLGGLPAEDTTPACPCSLTTPIDIGFSNVAFPIVPPTSPSGIIVTNNTTYTVFADICGGCSPEGNNFFYDFNRPAQTTPITLPNFRQTFTARTFAVECRAGGLLVSGLGNAAGTGAGTISGTNVPYLLFIDQISNTVTLTIQNPFTGVTYSQGPQPLPVDIVVATC